MNLRRLSVFVKVVDEGSFSSAARALGLPRSAVSQAVAALERELGARLLQRSSRAMSVTEAGAELHRKAAPALRTLEEASLAVTDQHGPLRGAIRMTAPVEVGSRMLEPVLSRFLREHPGVTIELRLTTTVLDLTGGGIDLAVRGGPIRDGTVVARRLGGPADERAAGLFASPDYLARRGTPKRIGELSEHDTIVVHGPRGGTNWKLEGPRGARTIAVRPRLTVDAWGYAARAAGGGLGIALLPLFLVAPELRAGELVRVLASWGVPGSTLWLVYPSARYLRRPVVALRDALTRAFPS